MTSETESVVYPRNVRWLMNRKPFQINNDISRAETLPAAMYVDPVWCDRGRYSAGSEPGTDRFHKLLPQFLNEN